MSGLVRVRSVGGFFRLCAVGLFLLVITSGSAAAGACPDRMAAYWKLDEAVGSAFADAAGGLDGSCVGDCPVPVQGKIGNARQFAASYPSAIEAPGASFDWGADASFSIEFWVKKEPGTLSGDEAVVSRTEDPGAVNWWAGIGGSGEAVFVLIGAGSDSGDPAQHLRSTRNLVDGKWHHVAAIRDGASGENRLYVDGVLEDAVQAAYGAGFAAAAGTPLAIGGFPGSFFTGIVDEVAIHHRALAEREVRSHYYLVRDYCTGRFAPVKIMPFGDSITTGVSSGVDDPNFQIAYRKDLWNLLAGEGLSIDYVGSQMVGQGYQGTEGFDPDNEGHAGWNDSSLAGQVFKWASTYQPEVILLHAGTNELDASPADIQRLLDEIDRYSEDVTVVLARIINRVPYSQTTTDFNDNVEAMARARIAMGDKIILVDQENGAGLIYKYYPEGDMWNKLHPYGSGYAKMAAVWQAALTDFLPGGQIDPAPAIISSPVIAAHVGNTYSYKVKAAGAPPPVFSLITAPAEMSIDPASGLISWTPSVAGSFGVTVEAVNSEGVDLQSFTISVEELCPAGLISFWKLDESVAGTYADVLGINQGLCAHNCPTPTHEGRIFGGQEFGSLKGVHVLPNGSFDWGAGDSFSIEYWMKKIPKSGAGIEVAVGRIDSVNKLQWWAGLINGKAVFTLKSEGGLGVSLQGVTALGDGAWHHLVMVRDASADQNLLYVDGELQNFTTATYAAGFGSTRAGLNIGWLNQGDGSYFKGAIDEIALHRRALPAEEIDQHYSDGAALRDYCGNAVTLAPALTSVPVTGALLGTPYAYQVEAQGLPAPVFSLVTAPAGMNIDPATGLIQWTPAVSGSFEVTVEAANSEGVDRQSFTIGVLPGGSSSAGLVALYHFDQTQSESGQFVYDFSGNGHDATCEPVSGGCPAWTPEGKLGGAFSYDGLDDRFTIPDDPAWDLADFTIATWVNIHSFAGSDMHLWGHRGAGSSSRALWLHVNRRGGVTFTRNNGDLVASPFPLATNRWYHLAVTYSAATGEAALYIDGVLADEGSQTGSLYATSNVVDLGFRTAKGDSPFHGMIDELAVWDRPLPAGEVGELASRNNVIGLLNCDEGETRPCYSGPAATEGVGVCQGGVQTCIAGQWGLCEGEIVPQPETCGDRIDQDCNGSDAVCSSGGGSDAAGLLALYHFDRTAGESDQFVFDFSGNGHHAACGPLTDECPVWTPTGKFGGAFGYDGTNDRFVIPDDPAWDLADFTMAAWVNIRGYTGSDMHILGHRGATTASRALWLLVSSSKGNRVTFIRNGAIVAICPFTLETGRWYHVAVTYTAATGATALYIDGQLTATGTQTGSLYSTSNVVDLGFRTAKGDNPFAGMIDEVAVWGRALTAEEIGGLAF